MDDDVKAEFDKLKKEIDDLKRERYRHERILKQLSSQLSKAIKQIRTLKDTSHRNGGAIDGIKSILRNMGR